MYELYSFFLLQFYKFVLYEGTIHSVKLMGGSMFVIILYFSAKLYNLFFYSLCKGVYRSM